METPPYTIQIPPAFAAIAGEPDPKTRIFRTGGTHDEMTAWFDALCEHIGPTVSPGGAAVYSGTTRPGVYKRLRAGKMTAFCFHIMGKKKELFGGEKKLKELPLVYIPVSECKAWKAELEQRSARIVASKERVESAEDSAAFDEAETDEHTDRMHDFLHYDPKDKGKRGVRYVEKIDSPNERH
jgi:hypothetical protein